jgi:threonine aldolase
MSMPVDLRSDTVTQPTAGMRQAMLDAVVGDDVFNEDPTIHALQARTAAMAGLEAGLYVPSGTMANQLALLVHCRPGDDVLLGEGSHLYMYESGAGAAIAGVQFSIVGQGGHFTADELVACIKQTDAAGHIPPSTLVAVENTHNRGGGLVMSPSQFADISAAAKAHGLGMHLDGARLFNAAASEGVGIDAWGRHTDTVSICLSKGLGAPVGSVLCGSEIQINRARRYRKMLGGGMRQAGVIAAAGLYALDNHIEGLVDDHHRARRLAEHLSGCSGASIEPHDIRSNIVIFDVVGSAAEICEQVADTVLVLPVGPNSIRAVFHHQVDDVGLERTMNVFTQVLG